MPKPLEVLADLQLSVEGEPVDVQANGDRIVVNLPSLEVGRRMLSTGPLSRWSRMLPRRAHAALEQSKLTLELRVRGTTLAVVGHQAQPGRIGRWLPIEGVEVRPTQTLLDAARRRPLLTTAVVGGLIVLGSWLVSRLFRS